MLYRYYRYSNKRYDIVAMISGMVLALRDILMLRKFYKKNVQIYLYLISYIQKFRLLTRKAVFSSYNFIIQ